ncbi:integrin beta-like protein D isoform X2 [Crassostrea angulata]|uniref:integrin beta-like protein D isoform X2 n=1 Tax=Magallana angulata TaxID=2784310 RepID=UPI0022B1CCE7|nr:integrin beta-like protein D isoform X2 [Crassostrea angulata]
MMLQNNLEFCSIFLLLFTFVNTAHFRGGTISWKATGNGNEVQFSFKLGWAYGRGPGCTAATIGQLVTNMNSSYWQCTSGCGSTLNIANVNYICTGASQSENWEQGENVFTYTFAGIGPYKVEFTGGDWVTLSYGSPGSWSIGTVVYLAKRNDTNLPNTSPVTTGKPTYRVQYGCRNEILIPVVDADGDDVRCRWSNGTECVSICDALPNAVIDSNTCTIRFSATHTSNGTFAVAVTVEDFSKSNISIGGHVYSTSSPLSTVTLQFLVKTPPLTVNCNDKPVFVSPTLAQGFTVHVDILKALNVSFYVSGSRRITGIGLTTPAGMTYTPLQVDHSRNKTVFVRSMWRPQQNQVGSHILCALAEDVLGKTSESRCIKILVKDISPCDSSPCEHGGSCIRQGITQNYVCNCVSGYTGSLCQTDIDECSSHPCHHGGTCRDGVNMFSCFCSPGFTGRMCQTDIDECASRPCQNQGTCNDLVNQYNCTCMAGYSGYQCQTDTDECVDHPCSSLFDCQDLVNHFSCTLNTGKLMAILMSLMLIAGVLTFLFLLAKRRRYKDVDHTCFRTKIPHKKLQHRWTVERIRKLFFTFCKNNGD